MDVEWEGLVDRVRIIQAIMTKDPVFLYDWSSATLLEDCRQSIISLIWRHENQSHRNANYYWAILLECNLIFFLLWLLLMSKDLRIICVQLQLPYWRGEKMCNNGGLQFMNGLWTEDLLSLFPVGFYVICPIIIQLWSEFFH